MVLIGWRRFLNIVTLLPQRYVLAVMGLLANTNCMGMRGTLSMTISQMVVRVASSSQQITGETCTDPNNVTVSVISNTTSTTSQHGQHQLYDWDESTQGFILSSFYYGFLVSQLPSGVMSEKFGGKWVLFTGILLTSLATLGVPWAVQVGGVTGLVIARVLQGIGEGIVCPSLLLMMSRWVPPTERSIFAALVFGGSQVGNAVGPYLSGLILGSGNHWSYVYYVFGMFGAAWCLFWTFLGFNTPNEHPFISMEEQVMLNKTAISTLVRKKLDPVPVKALFTCKPLWALVIACVGHNFGYVLMVTVLPKYFLNILKFNIKETGLMTALPFIVTYGSSLLLGALCDFSIKKKWHSIETGRKIYVTIANGVAGVFMILASYSGCDRTRAVICLGASMTMMGAYYVSIKVNAIDLAPNYAGTCSAIVVGSASFSGAVSPYMVGLMTPDQTIAQWRRAFWVTFTIIGISNLVFVIWGKADQQWWDDVEQFGYPESWNGPTKKRATDEKANPEASLENNVSTIKVNK